MSESTTNDELYEMVLAEYNQMTIDIAVNNALLSQPKLHDVPTFARRLVEAEDSKASFIGGPVFLWLIAQAIERQDSRFDWAPHMDTFAQSRWLPVLFDLDDTPFKGMHPGWDTSAHVIAAEELTAHTESGVSRGILAMRDAVANAIEARYGPDEAEEYDVDQIVAEMLDIGDGDMDAWNFGLFWQVVDGNRCDEELSTEPEPMTVAEAALYEMVISEFLVLQSKLRQTADALTRPPRCIPDDAHTRTLRHEEAQSAYWDFLDRPEFVWMVDEGESRADVRVDWAELDFEYGESRWLPVLDALAGVPLDEEDPMVTCDAESYAAAAAELCTPASLDGRPQSVHSCVINAIDRRYGQGSSAQFDLDGIIEMMLEIDMPTPDEWDFGTFWAVAHGQRSGE